MLGLVNWFSLKCFLQKKSECATSDVDKKGARTYISLKFNDTGHGIKLKKTIFTFTAASIKNSDKIQKPGDS